jgi:hypothetical protein
MEEWTRKYQKLKNDLDYSVETKIQSKFKKNNLFLMD